MSAFLTATIVAKTLFAAQRFKSFSNHLKQDFIPEQGLGFPVKGKFYLKERFFEVALLQLKKFFFTINLVKKRLKLIL